MSISTVISSSIAKPRNNWDLRHNEATTQDIVQLILWADDKVQHDTKNFAKDLEGYCLEETANNIHHALTRNVKFVEDPDGVQMLKSPAQLWNDKKGDCKSFALFTASVLQNLGIDYTYRFVSESTAPVHHVYVVVTDADGTEYVIDPTVKEFNSELPYNHRIDHVMQYSEASSVNGNRSVNRKQEFAICGNEGNAHIGDITDQFLFKLAPNKRDQLRAAIRDNIRNASPFFVYLFYFKTWQAQTNPIRPLPRAAIFKLKAAMELFWKMANAFQFNTAVISGPFQLLSVAIDKFFKNETRLVITPGEHTENWTILSQGYPSWAVTNFLRKEGNNYILDLNETALSEYYARMMLFTVNGKKGYEHLEMLPAINSEFIDFQKDNNAPAALQTPEGVISNAFTKSVSDNSWVVGYFTARTDKNNLVVFCHADTFQYPHFMDMFPAGKFAYIDLRFYTKHSDITQIKGVHKIVKSMRQGNAIALEIDVPAPPGHSQNIIAAIYKLPAFITTISAAKDYYQKTNDKQVKMTRNVQPVKVDSITLQHNGSYVIKTTLATTTTSTNAFGTLTLPGGSVLTNIFDPDGLPLSGATSTNLYKPFTITRQTPYVSGKNKIGDFGVSAIVAIVTAVATIVSTIAGIIASIKAPTMGDVPDPGGDFRFDESTCKVLDATAGTFTCLGNDGLWHVIDAGGNDLGVDPNAGTTGTPPGSGNFFDGILNFFKTPAGLGLAGLGLFAVVSEDKSKRKRR